MNELNLDISKHIKTYVAVFAALALFTLATVVAAQINASRAAHVAIALCLAGVKGSLVAAVFMHLKWERAALLWGIILLCVILVFALLVLPILTAQDLPPDVHMQTWG